MPHCAKSVDSARELNVVVIVVDSDSLFIPDQFRLISNPCQMCGLFEFLKQWDVCAFRRRVTTLTCQSRMTASRKWNGLLTVTAERYWRAGRPLASVPAVSSICR